MAANESQQPAGPGGRAPIVAVLAGIGVAFFVLGQSWLYEYVERPLVHRLGAPGGELAAEPVDGVVLFGLGCVAAVWLGFAILIAILARRRQAVDAGEPSTRRWRAAAAIGTVAMIVGLACAAILVIRTDGTFVSQSPADCIGPVGSLRPDQYDCAPRNAPASPVWLMLGFVLTISAAMVASRRR